MVKDPRQFHVQCRGRSRAVRTTTGLWRCAGESAGAAAGRHLDPASAGSAGRIPAAGRHLVFPPRRGDLQGTRGIPRLPDARATAGTDHPRVQQRRRNRAGPVRRQRHDAGRRQETRPALSRLRIVGRIHAVDQAAFATGSFRRRLGWRTRTAGERTEHGGRSHAREPRPAPQRPPHAVGQTKTKAESTPSHHPGRKRCPGWNSHL